jgi:hypothetical protein
MITFVAKYPKGEEFKEGMAQRIVAIDEFFLQDERVYISIAFFRSFRANRNLIRENCSQYELNLFVHFFQILRLLSSSQIVYFHSIINFFRVWICYFFLKKEYKTLVLDVHGIVPEEFVFDGKRGFGILYNIAEKYLFNTVNIVICVTDSMTSFYKQKYPNNRPKYIRYSIIPKHIYNSKINFSNFTEEQNGNIKILYSGNLQKWQNIPAILDIVEDLNGKGDFNFIFLTGEPSKLLSLLNERKMTLDNITIKSVSPDELSDYYSIAHYGLILRDDIALNRVSCPTKVIEYLYHGLTPIVKLIEIGDFQKRGYEYLQYKEIGSNLKKYKSVKNHDIVRELIADNNRINLRSIIFGV